MAFFFFEDLSIFFIFYFAKYTPNLKSFINDHTLPDKPTTVVVFHELGDEGDCLPIAVEDHSIIAAFPNCLKEEHDDGMEEVGQGKW